MKLSELISNLNTVSKPAEDIEISAVCYDSRKVTKDCLFICLEGVSFDGHAYALQAEKSGAAAAISVLGFIVLLTFAIIYMKTQMKEEA